MVGGSLVCVVFSVLTYFFPVQKTNRNIRYLLYVICNEQRTNKGLLNDGAYRKNVELVEYRLKGTMSYQKNTLSVISRTKIQPY